MTLWLVAIALFLTPDGKEKIVENGLTPKGAKSIVFKEDLRFGADEGDDEYLFAAVNPTLDVDSGGNIYVGDSKSNEIRVFDAKGKYIKTLAKAGAGPGEMQAISLVQFLGDGSMVAFESKPMFAPQAQYFDKKGTYVTTKKSNGMANSPVAISYSPDGKHYAGTYMSVDPQAGALVTKAGLCDAATFTPIKEFSNFTTKVDFSQMGNPDKFADMMGNIISGYFKGTGVFAWDAEGNLYSAVTNKYEVTKWSGDLTKKALTIRRQFKPRTITDREKRTLGDKTADMFRDSPFGRMINDDFILRMIDKIDFPMVNLPIESIGLTDTGYLFVLNGNEMAQGKQSADVFNPAGVYIGRTTLDNYSFIGPDNRFRMVFKKGYAYTFQTDEEGENRVVRYKYSIGK